MTPPPPAAVAGTWTLGDLTVNRMGFGSMRLTVDPDRARALRVLRRAAELGVDHVDTAAFYRSPGGVLGVGTGETRYATELIRDAFAPYRDGPVVVTKVGPGEDPVTGRHYQASCGEHLRSQVEENLRRLGRDVLDVVNLRIIKKPGADSVAERFGALAEMRDAGMIRHLGLSNVRLDHVDEAQAIAPVVCVQNSYAVDIRRDDDLLVECGRRGIAFVPFFAIAGGRREAGATDDDPPTVAGVAQRRGLTPQQVRLAWTLHRGDNVLAIPGTGDVRHVEENVAAAAVRLSEEEMRLLDEPTPAQ